jgi:hypothetical protein
MKKNYVVILAMVLLGFMTFGCSSGPKSRDPNVPDWVLNPPTQEDVIYGIGTAKLSNVNQSMTIAEARARTSLAFQLNTAVQAMITDYNRSAGTENSQASLNFAESVSRQLTQTKLTGAVPDKREQTKDGIWWVRVKYGKADAAKAASDIIENEASRYAEFKATEALKLLDANLDKLDGTQPKVIDN